LIKDIGHGAISPAMASLVAEWKNLFEFHLADPDRLK